MDALTVDLVTRSPDPVMPQRLAAYGAWIVGAKAMAAGGAETMRTAPVGAGPYKLSEFVRDTRLVLSSHDDYWMGRPAAREVRIEVVPEAATRIAGLISGEYDIVTNLLPDQMPQLDGYDDVEALAVPLDLVHMLFYDTRRPAVADARIRQALNHAIDYDATRPARSGAHGSTGRTACRPPPSARSMMPTAGTSPSIPPAPGRCWPRPAMTAPPCACA